MSEVSLVNCSISDLPYWFLSVKVKTLRCLDPYAPERNYYFFFSSWIFHLPPPPLPLPNALPAARREVICSGHVDHLRQMKSRCQCELSTWQAVLTLFHSQQWSICWENDLLLFQFGKHWTIKSLSEIIESDKVTSNVINDIGNSSYVLC